jgi:hypothetical protein
METAYSPIITREPWNKGKLVQKETPRLCRGGSRSLTNPGVHP